MHDHVFDGPFKALMTDGTWRHGIYVCTICAQLFTKREEPCLSSSSLKLLPLTSSVSIL